MSNYLVEKIIESKLIVICSVSVVSKKRKFPIDCGSVEKHLVLARMIHDQD